MKVLRADSGGEFISTILMEFYNHHGIAIKYSAPYLYDENELVKQGWKTPAIMKNLLIIDSGLLNNFWAEAMENSNYLENKLPTKNKNHKKLFLEKAWTGNRQNFDHVHIFGSLVLVDIP